MRKKPGSAIFVLEICSRSLTTERESPPSLLNGQVYTKQPKPNLFPGPLKLHPDGKLASPEGAFGDEDEEDGHGPELTGAHLPSLLTGTATAPSHVRSVQPPAPQLVPLTDLLGLLLATRSELRPWLWAPGGSLGFFWSGWWHFLAPLQSRITTLLFQALSRQETWFSLDFLISSEQQLLV